MTAKPSEEIEIRRGRIGDGEALKKLLESLGKEDEVRRKMRVLEGKEDSWIHNLTKDDRVHNKENPGKWLYFAFDGDNLIGHVNGIAWDSAPPEAEQQVENMKAKYNLVGRRVGHVGIAVQKDYRQKGIGEELMVIAIREARELGVGVLTISIKTENTPMNSLAEKLGFKEHMREREGERESILMTLDLVP